MPTANPLTTDEEALRKHCPRVAYALAENFLTAQQLVCDRLGLDPTQFTIYATLLSANSQHSMRDASTFAMAGLPRLLPVSRRAIAAATGLPRETVRRQVQYLVHRGLAAAQDEGVVAVLDADVLSAIEILTEQGANVFNRACNVLIRLGAIRGEDPSDSKVKLRLVT